jgi:hypothetical protein
MFKNRKKIRFVLKSGRIFDVTVSKLTVTGNGSGITKMEWTDMRPRPLFFFKCEDVAAVFEL